MLWNGRKGTDDTLGDRNQLIFLQKRLPAVAGPILEIGSKDYGSKPSFRHVYPDAPYVGIDMEAGVGVHAIVDLEAGIGPLTENPFQLAVRPQP